MKIICATVVSLALFACGASKKMESWQNVSFDKEAHRGGRGLMPENTIPAMLNGIDEGVNTLELDVHITKDKKVVVSHDPYFNEAITTTPEGSYLTKAEAHKRLLYNLTYDSIRRYDVGLKPYPDFPRQKKIAVSKPLLSDLVEATEAYAARRNRQIGYNIEIKSKPATDNINHPGIPEYVTLVVSLLQKRQVLDRTIIQSFDERALQFIHEKYPAVKTSLLVAATDKKPIADWVQELGFAPAVFSPHYSLVTSDLVKACHKLNIRVIPWTVNTLQEIRALKQKGVDGVITDYPDVFKRL